MNVVQTASWGFGFGLVQSIREVVSYLPKQRAALSVELAKVARSLGR